ncbi:MAG TPA: inositol monophosphatase family protein [Gemmatimonadales bacterium]|nr:inositol monophosphatase family protein [Gemmatimonadales bacterium]
MLADLDLVRIARDAALAAADYIRTTGRPGSTADWDEKSSHDFVSDVDRGAEEVIRKRIGAAAPGTHIVGEELGPELSLDGTAWIVDPIDGTTNFLHGYPTYAVSVAAAVDGILAAGVVVHVPDGRIFHAVRGQGAFCDDTPIRVSSITDPGQALIGTGFPFKDLSGMDRYVDQFRRVALATAGIRRPGSAALDLCSVAAGEYDAFWELSLSAWDIAAGTLIVREAGGRVTDDTGRDTGIEHGPVVAGNEVMHEWMMTVVRRKS